MTTRRTLTALLVLALLVAVAGFLVPVRPTGFDNCGVAGTWITGLLGDPTGPTDTAGTYAEYNACRLAARPALALMLSALLVAAVAGLCSYRFQTRSGGR